MYCSSFMTNLDTVPDNPPAKQNGWLLADYDSELGLSCERGDFLTGLGYRR